MAHVGNNLEKEIESHSPAELSIEHDENVNEKGEDPVEHIDWSVRQIIATASLAALWVG